MTDDPAPIRVLHVDDDRDFAELTATMLEREAERFTVETATSANEGLDRLESETFDCVVSDYDMPVQNGIDFLKTVRETRPDLPFILFTGKGSETIASEAISVGVTDYLQKNGGTDQYTILANRIENAVRQYRAERTAERVRRRLSELSNNTNDVLWMFSEDWDELLFVNDAYEDIWGRSVDTLTDNPRDFLDGVHPDDREHVEAAMERLSNGESVDMEVRVNAEEDYGRWIWIQGTPIVDDDSVIRVAGFARDVTDRREREDELRRKTRVMDEAPIGITITDPDQPDNPIIYANDQFIEMTGYSEESILGRNCRFLQGPETDPDRVAEMRDAIDAGDSVQVELRNYRNDGTEFWNRLSIAPVRSDGELVNFAGFQQDVTRHKERERERNEQQAFIEQSLDALEDVYYVFDPEGNIRRWNDRISEVTGYTDDEIADMHVTEFFPEEQRERIIGAVETCLSEGTVKVQADYLTKDGERIPYEFTGTRLTDHDGDLMGFAGIGRDLTERLEYERQLEQQNERLEEFASIVSHDLRNPLSVAKARLDLARREDDPEQLDAVADAHERMEQLIDELLDLAREGKIITDVQTVMLADVLETCWQTVDTRDATLSVEEDCIIEADEGALRQLFANLVTNAVEHGREDVTIVAGPLPDRNGFYIADDGPGVPEDERDRVFESGYSTGEEGIGEGLSIVRRISEAHGWDVRVTESQNGGARFEVIGVETPD